MKLSCNEIGLKLEISPVLIEQVYALGNEYYPKEFGGILVGNYSEDQRTCYVTGTVLPQKFKSGKYIFERGAQGLKSKLQNYFNQVPRTIYLGEWHTHPTIHRFQSSAYISAMKLIARHDRVSISNPIMVIAEIENEKV